MRDKKPPSDVPGGAKWKRDLVCLRAPEYRAETKIQNYKGRDTGCLHRCAFFQQLLPQMTAGPWARGAQGDG